MLNQSWWALGVSDAHFKANQAIGSASLIAQLVKNPPAMQETLVRFLGWEDPLEKGKATHSSILAWRMLWTVYPLGSKIVGHNGETFTFYFHKPY